MSTAPTYDTLLEAYAALATLVLDVCADSRLSVEHRVTLMNRWRRILEASGVEFPDDVPLPQA